MDSATWAHEIGHLMGLGDDYYHERGLGHAEGDPMPGREGTLMAGGHESQGTLIDQNLADRLADIVNKVAKLPQCWQGTLREHDQGNLYDDTWR